MMITLAPNPRRTAVKRNIRPFTCLCRSLLLCSLFFLGCTSTPEVSETKSQELSFAREPVVLVCQADTLSPDQGIVLLSYALSPLIRRDLFCVQAISVIPTEDTIVPPKSYFLNRRGLEKFARAYGADVIAVCLVTGDAERVSMKFKAYDVDNGYIMLKTNAEGKPADFFKLQRSLVNKFIDALGIVPDKEELKRINSCSPKQFEAALCFGDGLRCEESKRNRDALFSYRDALQADDSLAVPYMAEARVYRKLNVPLRAMQSLQEAVARDAFYAEAWYQLSAHAAQFKQDEELALEYCKKALEIAPRFGKARLSVGTRMYALGDVHGAIEETKKAANLLKTSVLPRYNLGVYYRDLNQIDEARLWFDRALKIDPEFELARSELQKLQNN
jgi:tetratricopeptide (TPR) repeat protein